MKIIPLIFISVFCLNVIYGQEVILNTRFPVRDFDIVDNSLVYIEKRGIKSYNLKTKTRDTLIKKKGFFIGGYGVRLFYSRQYKQIITASNELVKDRSSIRFYDVVKKDINKYHVYYTTELMDFWVSPKDSLFFLSKKNKQIEVFKYWEKPRYKKIDSIKIDSFSRNLEYYNNKLYFITDSGKVFEYNIITRKKRLLYYSQNLLVNFVIDKQNKYIYATTFDGKLIKINLIDNSLIQEIILGNQLIESIDIVDNKYVVTGDWTGEINIIDCSTLDVKKSYNNKNRIIKILVSNNHLYTSSIDRTIKKWNIN
jgi:hypothetical protein